MCVFTMCSNSLQLSLVECSMCVFTMCSNSLQLSLVQYSSVFAEGGSSVCRTPALHAATLAALLAECSCLDTPCLAHLASQFVCSHKASTQCSKSCRSASRVNTHTHTKLAYGATNLAARFGCKVQLFVQSTVDFAAQFVCRVQLSAHTKLCAEYSRFCSSVCTQSATICAHKTLQVTADLAATVKLSVHTKLQNADLADQFVCRIQLSTHTNLYAGYSRSCSSVCRV